ncbi:MAG: DUF1540 domain-containing protein [Clostridia bacterium]
MDIFDFDSTKIECDACECEYHEEGNHCSADCVCIGPCNAKASSDTICSTFKPKE